MHDDVIRTFRERVRRDAAEIREESAIVRLVADPMSGEPPSRYHGMMLGIGHFEPGPGGVLRERDSALPFHIDFSDDYCSCVDGSLQLRVIQLHAPIAHPNVGAGGAVCLGPRFRPGTGLRPLLEQLHAICSSRVFATDNPFDAKSADFYRRHPERVRALHSEPLWVQPVAGRVRVAPASSGRGTR